MKARLIASAVFAVIVATVLAAIVIQKERLLARGDRVFLRLAPVDPRSLMQGDYMALRYSLAEDLSRIRAKGGIESRRGLAVVALDEKGIAVSVRLYGGPASLAPGEKLLRYKLVKGDIIFGADSFFFQEGRGDLYENARYGELVVDDSGSSVLAGLRDDKLNVLGAR